MFYMVRCMYGYHIILDTSPVMGDGDLRADFVKRYFNDDWFDAADQIIEITGPHDQLQITNSGAYLTDDPYRGYTVYDTGEDRWVRI